LARQHPILVDANRERLSDSVKIHFQGFARLGVNRAIIGQGIPQDRKITQIANWRTRGRFIGICGGRASREL